MEVLTLEDLVKVSSWGREVQKTKGLLEGELALLIIIEDEIEKKQELAELEFEDCLSCKL